MSNLSAVSASINANFYSNTYVKTFHKETCVSCGGEGVVSYYGNLTTNSPFLDCTCETCNGTGEFIPEDGSSTDFVPNEHNPF